MVSRSSVDIAVIGGGAAGLVAAAGTAALGARTVLIERDRLGGECTWTGCVPSKALLHIAHQARSIQSAAPSGVRAAGIEIDFHEVMDSVRSTRRRIYAHGESPDYLKTLGIQPLQATARFLDAETVLIQRGEHKREISFRAAIVATGSRPFVPEIRGLEGVDFLTTDTLFEFDALPQRLAILGGGPTGVEMAQAFARLGSTVTLITYGDQLLPAFEQDAAELLQARLASEGVSIHLRSTISSARMRDRDVSIEVVGDGEPMQVDVDRLLLATGRIASTAGLGLEAAGVEYERDGIPVDDYCRTSATRIFASGDVTIAPNLTHVAEDMSKAAAINALARLPVRKYERAILPSVIYTDPEIATVGRTEEALLEDGADFDRIDLPYTKIDRAVIEGRPEGFVRVYHRHGKILGATVAGAQAGEMVTEYALAMRHGLRLHALSDTIHPYPTMMLGARRAADQFYARLLQPWMVRAFQTVYGYRGEVPAYIGTSSIL